MKIAILGVGAYGIALANIFFKNGMDVSMWTKFQEEYDIVTLKRENPSVLPGVHVPEKIAITTDLKMCIEDAKIIVMAVPMGAVRVVAKELAGIVYEQQIITIVSKGIEQNTNLFMSEILSEEIKSNNICMISGPSFASEIARGISTGFVVASEHEVSAAMIKSALENENIIVQTSKDLIGVQVAAATKNVFAIMMGILDGMNLEECTRASVLTLLVKDLRLIIEVLGGKSNTVFTYAGIGDMLLTCMSSKSRNYTFGKYLGQGFSKEEAFNQMMTKTVEGLYTLKSLSSLLKEKEVEIKSVEILFQIVYEEKKVENVLREIKN